ncbi:predicted protein [Arabidopsis lyrata subsp. lyrata]|uniref:Predicted protein n=1 Tax=Arabidopsis lyrata subsp. lyrata TaxID=81972 RepID=D7M2P8_ARALL|nr:predicted protein [Arabidopsis lyrata subsp. lyrata]
MAEPEPRDDPEYMKNFPNGFLYFDVTHTCFLEEDRDSNLEEESAKINPELCDDVFARKPQLKDSASCSAINEATKKTYTSSSRNRDSSESGEIRRVGDKEDDRKSQLSPNAAPWSPNNNTYQQLPVANQIRGTALEDPNYAPWRLQNTYQQLPVANQMVKDSIMNPYQHSMADHHNFYQHLVADLKFWNAPRRQPRSFAIGQNYFNSRQARPELNLQMLQRVPQTQQPTQFQGLSSEQG